VVRFLNLMQDLSFIQSYYLALPRLLASAHRRRRGSKLFLDKKFNKNQGLDLMLDKRFENLISAAQVPMKDRQMCAALVG